MQNYIDELAKFCAKKQSEAEVSCKVFKSKIDLHNKKGSAVAAKILGVSESEIGTNKINHFTFTTLKKWKNVDISLCRNDSWKKHKQELCELKKKHRECCEKELYFRELSNENSMFAFRRFLRARYGAKPSVSTSADIQEFVNAQKPFVCKAR